jgi:hypothetical protein
VHQMARMHGDIALLRKTTSSPIARRPASGRALPASNIMAGDRCNSLSKSLN